MADVDLALHCLAGIGSVNTPACKIILERTHVMNENLCDGLSIRDQLFAFLVEAVKERNELEEKLKLPTIKKKVRKNAKRLYDEATGQIAALSYSVALMDNPYDVDAEYTLASAEMEASE